MPIYFLDIQPSEDTSPESRRLFGTAVIYSTATWMRAYGILLFLLRVFKSDLNVSSCVTVVFRKLHCVYRQSPFIFSAAIKRGRPSVYQMMDQK
jgi:hypothetical protein